MSSLEDAKACEHRRQLIAAEDERRLGSPTVDVIYPYNGYVVLCWDEPIEGLPSHRIYGPYKERDEAWEEGKALSQRSDTLTVAVLPLRQTAQMEQER